MVMKKDDILKSIESLSYSQGFYGRVLNCIEENPEILNELENQNFKDVVDMVLYLEC